MYLFIQFDIVSLLLLLSTIAAWYEGSAILHNPWEWKNSTPFSQLFHGEVQSSNQISNLDHFIYAAKFEPVFQIIMVISSIYLVILLGYHFLKRQHKRFVYYLSFWGGALLLLSFCISNSPKPGGQILFYIWLLSGFLCLVTAASIFFRFLNTVSTRR